MIHINKIFEQSIIFYVITEQFFELFMLTTIALSRFFEINFKQDFHSAPPTTNLHMSLILKFISLKFFFPLTLSQMWCSVTYVSSLENLLQGYQFFFSFLHPDLMCCKNRIVNINHPNKSFNTSFVNTLMDHFRFSNTINLFIWPMAHAQKVQ